MESYFRAVELEVDRAYTVASRARSEGLDPEIVPEIPRAEDMAMRVEKLLGHLGVEGVAQEIRRLSASLPREELAVTVARTLARDTRRPGSIERRVDAALRVGLAILTEGILVAPLEGLAEVHLRTAPDGRNYLELYYAGPIRSAGGTAQALSVLLADVVRRDLGIGEYRPEDAEVERYKEEIPLYKHFQHLQYVPTSEEIETVVRHVPVCVSGESTEGEAEVSAFRNLARVPTNGIRGGACLVIAEGLCQKAAKLRKIVETLEVPGWGFLDRLGHHGEETLEESSVPKYLREAPGGRPVLAHPNRPGAFRLAYGRSRSTGLAACGVHPATMIVLRRFVAVGAQMKLEYPGKATAVSLCDTIDGPIVELEDGTLTAVRDPARAEELVSRIARIVDLGELLVGFGEFLENNRRLVPGAYTPAWHREELRAAGAPDEARRPPPTYDAAVAESRQWQVPLAPEYLLFWHDLTPEEIRALSEFVEARGRWEGGGLDLPIEEPFHESLVKLGFLHGPHENDRFRGEPELSEALLGGLGLRARDEAFSLERTAPLEPLATESLVYVSRLAGVPVRARGPSRVGARMGRPEKAFQRSLRPNVHALFPIGEAGGPQRSISAAARRTTGSVPLVDLGRRQCPRCGKFSVWLRCACGAHTEATGELVSERLPIGPLWTEAVARLHFRKAPEVKGVKGLTSPGKVPELLEKGLLRAAHRISVYQDGTARFDLTDLPLTHVRPSEIGLSVERARALGYAIDREGRPLEDAGQLLELRPQDLVVAETCGDYLLRLSQFVDDELLRLYGMESFYRARRREDLIGAILVALAPHTSGGVVGRLVGFTAAEACFAHPVFHAAKRRNCDGDEDSVTLLLDALLNFSRSYLPKSRGALMDKPLVLTTRLAATEVDKEAHNLDVSARYPLALYHAADERQPAREVEPLVDTIGHRIGRSEPFAGLGFTHETTHIAGGPVRSAYRDAGSMARMVEESFQLTTQIRAVDPAEAVALVLNTHFLPDLMGNLKSFATQKFRCKVCGITFRRPPLAGRCTELLPSGGRCAGDLLPTVHEASIRKYLPLSQRLSAIDGVTPYLRQRVQLLASSLSTLFPGSPAQTTLDAFLPTRPKEPVSDPS